MSPQLRSDLRVSVQANDGHVCYVLEDPLGGRFFRLGLAEYSFVSLLDGRRTIAEAMSLTASTQGGEALDQNEALTLSKWLIDQSLATTDQSRSIPRLNAARGERLSRDVRERLNPMIQRLALCNPMPLLQRLDSVARLIFSRFGLLVWFAIVLLAFLQAIVSLGEWHLDSRGVLASDNWLWLIVAAAALKLLHEMGHAMAFRRFAGNVKEAGLVFVLFVPMPYVDVTESWRLASKWQRMLVSAAGMLLELLVAAIATLVWLRAEDPLVRQHAMNVMVTASVVTLLFNANPLMRFDAYYLLADWLELPNLATRGRQWLAFVGKRYVLGMPVQPPSWPEGKQRVIKFYAIAALIWRITVCVSLLLSAMVLFHGAGVLIALIAMTLWLLLPGIRLLGSAIGNFAAIRGSRLAMIAVSFVGLLVLSWYLVPWYSHARMPLVADYYPLQEVRPGAGGVLERSFFNVGDRVEAGQTLALLSNPELKVEHENLLLELERSSLRERELVAKEAISAAQAERETQVYLRSRLDHVREQLRELRVIAPAKGVITATDAASRMGMLVRRGEALFVIGTGREMKLVGLATPLDADVLRKALGRGIQVHLWGTGEVHGRVERVLPRAETALRHEALAGSAGGPIAVRPSVDGSELHLLRPRVKVLIEMESNEVVHAGQTGYARLAYRDRTLGKVIWAEIKDWIDAQQRNLQRGQVARR
ncbi:MAG: efflux RND transporter periplasmic adaptor subunit [Planctomycetota bacterium]